MTQVLDRFRAASGITRRPQPEPTLPARDAAEDSLLGLQDNSRQITLSVPGQPRGLRPWWVGHVEQELNYLLQLPSGWDGRRARPLGLSAVQKMVDILSTLMDDATALPQQFPLVDGGIQAEWHIGGNDIEIEVDAAGAAHILATTSKGNTIAEGVLEPAEADRLLEASRAFLRRLSARTTAVR